MCFSVFLKFPKTLIYIINVYLVLPTYLHLFVHCSFFCNQYNFYLKNRYFKTENVESAQAIIFFSTSDLLLSRITTLLSIVCLFKYPLVNMCWWQILIAILCKYLYLALILERYFCWIYSPRLIVIVSYIEALILLSFILCY